MFISRIACNVHAYTKTSKASGLGVWSMYILICSQQRERDLVFGQCIYLFAVSRERERERERETPCTHKDINSKRTWCLVNVYTYLQSAEREGLGVWSMYILICSQQRETERDRDRDREILRYYKTTASVSVFTDLCGFRHYV